MSEQNLTMGEMIAGRKKGDVWRAAGFTWEHHGTFLYSDSWGGNKPGEEKAL